jgi:hypothetical protein
MVSNDRAHLPPGDQSPTVKQMKLKSADTLAVRCSVGILLMASMVTGRSLSPIVNGIAAEAGPNVDLSGVSMHANHEAGSGRPVATEA